MRPAFLFLLVFLFPLLYGCSSSQSKPLPIKKVTWADGSYLDFVYDDHHNITRISGHDVKSGDTAVSYDYKEQLLTQIKCNGFNSTYFYSGKQVTNIETSYRNENFPSEKTGYVYQDDRVIESLIYLRNTPSESFLLTYIVKLDYYKDGMVKKISLYDALLADAPDKFLSTAPIQTIYIDDYYKKTVANRKVMAIAIPTLGFINNSLTDLFKYYPQTMRSEVPGIDGTEENGRLTINYVEKERLLNQISYNLKERGHSKAGRIELHY